MTIELMCISGLLAVGLILAFLWPIHDPQEALRLQQRRKLIADILQAAKDAEALAASVREPIKISYDPTTPLMMSLMEAAAGWERVAQGLREIAEAKQKELDK